ncbi:type I DNA topoisomerase [Dehalococcoidia bacterium]|nr:type I DNA topoisomerase [Dehalococcoidia bacterium]
MVKNLVIVESPAKTKTIEKYLGKNYKVIASIGHVRDLTNVGKGGLGIDVDNDFTPSYRIDADKKKVVKEIKDLAKKATKIFLATDPDREGEAIAWHVVEAAELSELSDKIISRITFNEITEKAVKEAFDNPKDLDKNLIDAHKARRYADRIAGFRGSRVLQSNITGGRNKGLSAGRVQSPTLGLIVDREETIKNFIKQEYWSISANLENKKHFSIISKLHSRIDNGKNILITDDQTEIKKMSAKKNINKEFIKSEEQSKSIKKDLENSNFVIKNIKNQEIKSKPPAPFITSTLQRSASTNTGISPSRTMFIAQGLYEGVKIIGSNTGLITYMRTDSTNISESSLSEIGNFIKEKYGNKYTISPRRYKSKSKNAQEAHEAIRPTSILNTPDKVSTYLNPDQNKIYKLIWNRAVASQMSDSISLITTVDILASGNKEYLLQSKGEVIKFDGHKILSTSKIGNSELPELFENESLKLNEVNSIKKFTDPPPRYNEASLIRKMEEEGIGRPSTYASIVQTIKNREYAQIEKKAFIPTQTGTTVTDTLRDLFKNCTQNINDLGFTSNMEEKLDLIANGKENWIEFLKKFYYPFEETVQKGINESKTGDRISIPTDPTGVFCEKGLELVKRGKKNNEFLGCSDWPDCETLLNLPIPENVKYDKYDNPVKCGSKPTVKKNNSPAKKSGVMCLGENELLIRKRKRDQKEFLSCSKFPRCRVAMPLPPGPNSDVKQQESWELSRVKAMKKCSELKVSGNGTSNIK